MLYFIVNPMSSLGQGMHIWEEIEDLLQDAQVEYQCEFLDEDTDLSSITTYIYTNLRPCTLAIVGGDGTIGSVLTALPGFDDLTLAYIPAGSGNDFARAMHLPSDPDEIVDMLLESDRTMSVNIGQATADEHKIRFAVSSGFGFDAEVCASVASSKFKRTLNRLGMGRLIYLCCALRSLSRLKPFDLRLLLDDAQLITYQDVVFAAVMNVKYEGGGFMFCPHAKPDDDELDLIVVNKIARKDIFRLLPKAMKGRHTTHPAVHIIRCKKAALQADHPVWLHADGDARGEVTKVSYGLHRQKFTLLLPTKPKSK